MTPEQVDLVRISFAKVASAGADPATLFYQRLFQIDPPLRHLFPSDLTAQSAKLMAALRTSSARSTGSTRSCRRCASSAAATPATASRRSTTQRSARL